MNDFIVQLIAKLDTSKTVKDIEALEKQLDSKGLKLKPVLDTATSKQEMTNFIKQMQSVLKTIGLDLDTTTIRSAVNQLVNDINSTTAQVNKIQISLGSGDFDTKILAYETQLKNLGLSADDVADHMSAINSAFSNLKVSASGTDIIPDDIVSNAKTLEFEMSKLSNTVKQLKLKESLTADDLKVEQTITRLNEQLRKNSAYSREAKKQIRSWLDELSKGNVAESRLKQINTEAKSLHATMGGLNKTGFSLKDKFTQAFGKITGWMAVMKVVQTTVKAVKVMTREVIELDKAQVELIKVSDLTTEGLEKVTDQAFEMGERVAKTGTQVLGAITEFKRAGYEMQDSLNMAEAAMVMTNVAEGITDTADAAGTLISVLKGYNMSESDAMSIVDMMNSTSNNSPIGFDELAEGLERTAGTMAQSGTTIQETIGLITAGYAQLRNVEKVSTSLVTLSARLRGVNEDGETIDGLSAELQESFGKIGVAIEDEAGNLRSIYAIAKDYSEVLPTLTSKQKQYYAELAAGKRNVTTWNAITQSFQDAENATTQALNSAGSAAEENEKYLNSIEGKMIGFKSALQDLARSVVDSNWIKGIVDIGTSLIKVLDGAAEGIGKITDKIGVLSSWGGNISNLGSTLGAISGLVMNKFGAGERTKFQWQLYCAHPLKII